MREQRTSGWVYALTDPRDQCVRYVGSTRVSPEHRLEQHIRRRAIFEHRVTKKQMWIAELATLALQPVLHILEEAPCAVLTERERWWRHHIATQQGMPYAAGWIGDTNPWAYRKGARPAPQDYRPAP